jgi:hypothetical protein
VLEHTGARSVFGHSGGGFVPLQAGLILPLERVAVCDRGLSILGRPSFAFIEPFEEAVRTGDDARAATVMSRAVYPDDPAAKLPFGMALLITRLFLQTPIGHRLADLLPTVQPEIRRIRAHDGPATDYAGITAEVLLTAGPRSPKYSSSCRSGWWPPSTPPWSFAQNCQAVADAIPGGRALVIPRSSRNTANIAQKGFVGLFAAFFEGSLATA